jgi:sodium-dependent phosphate cotransporter
MTHGALREKVLIASRVLRLLLFAFLFLFSIELMGSALKLLGGDVAASIVRATDTPLAGLFIGILATSIVQSSSFTTVTVAIMTGAGTISVRNAVPIIMGANIGTTVTNLLVSLVYVTRREEFNRAFGGAIVHDLFNILAVVTLLPIELATHFLERSASRASALLEGIGGLKVASPVKFIVGPFIDVAKRALIDGIGMAERLSGAVLLAVSLLFLFLSLYLLVKLIRSLVIETLEQFFNRRVFTNAGLFFLTGLSITAIVQSSSVTTSLMVPLLGAGVLTIERVYPYVLGANIGTTVTALLAALASGESAALTVALTHLFFNMSGTCIFYPLRFIPISLAKALGKRAGQSRPFALLYLGVLFFLVPLVVLLLEKCFNGR